MVRRRQATPTIEQLVEAMGGTKIICVGTPEDAIEMIEGLVEATGGFGTLLLLVGNDWASQEAANRSLELFAREVMPVFQDSSTSLVAAMTRAQEHREAHIAEQRASIDAARETYAGRRSNDEIRRGRARHRDECRRGRCGAGGPCNGR